MGNDCTSTCLKEKEKEIRFISNSESNPFGIYVTS